MAGRKHLGLGQDSDGRWHLIWCFPTFHGYRCAREPVPGRYPTQREAIEARREMYDTGIVAPPEALVT